MNVSLANDGIHDTVANVTFETKKIIHGLTINFVLRSPAGYTDKNYQREFLRTAVNVEKFTKGNRGNFMAATFLDRILDSLDFEMKFPLPVVRND